jgi:hypothetical protein
MQKYLSFIVVLLLLTSCSKKTEDVELKEIHFSKLADFEKDDMTGAFKAFRKTCDAISQKKGEFIDDSIIKINRKDILIVITIY